MKQIIRIAALSIFAAGCAVTQAPGAPTHQWVSNDLVGDIEYQRDHSQCLDEAGITASPRRLDSGSESFTAYTNCMNRSGYELTAYASQADTLP